MRGLPELAQSAEYGWADIQSRETRLHDARHTAATMLLVLGVPQRVVMDLMGWSHTAMTARYQHVSGQVRQDIAAQRGGLLRGANETR
jgi:integrase